MKIVGIDLFAGAGGLSLGAEMAGIDVQIAIENDSYAARTYQLNHPKTTVIVDDIKNVGQIDLGRKKSCDYIVRRSSVSGILNV